MHNVFGQTLEGDQSARQGTKNVAAMAEYFKGRPNERLFLIFVSRLTCPIN